MSWKYSDKSYGRKYGISEWFGCIWNREPHVVIPDSKPYYLLRWHLIPVFLKCPVNVYVHKFLRDDFDRMLHDHPRASISLCLSNGFVEIYQSEPKAEIKTRNIKPFSLVYRSSTFRHRVILHKDTNGEPIPALTLFMVGPKVRDWGFWCKEQFLHWSKLESDTRCE